MSKRKQAPAQQPVTGEEEGKTIWGEPMSEFKERMARLVVESRSWPVPWTEEWKAIYKEGDNEPQRTNTGRTTSIA